MDKPRLRIGFVGAGSMGQAAHLRNYAALPDCEVVAVAELREGLRERVAARYGVPRTYPSHEEMLAREDLDGIVASQPFMRHGVLVPELLKSGRPVFIEKPLAGSVEAGERIVEAVESSGTWLMVGYHKRSDPAVMRAVAEIARLRESGELGPMRYVRITMPPGDWVAAGFSELIRTDEKVPEVEWEPAASDMDEGTFKAYTAFVNFYIHQVNLMRHLMGEGYSVAHADPAGVLLVARAESGLTGVIEMAPYRTTIDWQEVALVAFEKGWLRLELPAPLASNRPGKLTIFRDLGGGREPETLEVRLPWVHAMRQQATNFLAGVRGERPPTCAAAEALEDLRVAREYIRLFKGL